MEIRIDGNRLDFAGDFKYKKNNQIFGFDALTADRTVSIKIPRTRRNAQILSHGERAEADGSEVRVIHAAEVYDGAIRHVGRLYITKADESGYTAVFCFGAVEALRSINGRMSDLTTDRLSQATDTPLDADIDGTAEPFRAIRYQQDDATAKYLPSFSVSVLLREAAASVGVSLTLPSAVEQLRILPSKAAGMKEQTIAFASSATTPAVVIGVDDDPSAPGNVPEQVLTLLPVTGTEVMVATEMITQDSVGTNVTHHEVRTEVRGWKALQPCTLTFPFDFPEELYLVEVRVDGSVNFFGGYSFTKVMTMDEDEESITPTWTGGQPPIDYGGIDSITIRTSDRVSSVSGEPLAGRSVNINAGTTFLFVTPSAFLSADSDVPPPTGYGIDDWRCSISGWVFGGDGLTYDKQVTVKGADEVLDGQVSLHDQMSDDDTLVAWLQDIAAITGTILRYDETSGLWFDVADIDGWSSVDLKRLAGWKDTERKMLDFGQVAEVKFKDDKNSSGSQAVEYKTFNDTLTERTTVRELLYSNGSAGLPAEAMVIRNGDRAQDVGVYCLTNPDGGGGGEDMSRVSLTPNSTIRMLASISTRQVRTALMSAVEIESIKPDTLLVSGGQRWAWTEANVSGLSVQWTLQKVGTPAPAPMEVFAVQSFSASEPNYNVAVMRICYTHGLSALPDRMTMAEAAAVTAAQISTGNYTIFSPNGDAEASNILSFNEFQYFTGVTSVQISAFNAVGATSQMVSITFPSSVTAIGSSAFVGCHALTSLILNEGLTIFNGLGHANATRVPQNLTELTLPSTVTIIGSRAFFNSKIVTLTCLATTPPNAAAGYALNPMDSLTSIKVPAASVAAYKTAAGWSQHASKITAI